jgi:energy-coupling factor transporter ATP-binding protein EcfA2
VSERPVLRLENVSLEYERGRRPIHALDAVSLDLFAGELAGVWGRRGSGKTSLVHVAAGIVAPTAGAVFLDGEVLAQDRCGTLHARIGLATRRGPELSELPVEDWIASALLTSVKRFPEALRLAHLALERAGAGHLASAAWDELSDGERMLAAIAQAIVRGPRVLLVDDPIAGLAGAERDEVMALLRSIATTGVAVMMTAAELVDLRGLDRIWALRGGRLEGPTVRPTGKVVDLRPTGEGRHGDR